MRPYLAIVSARFRMLLQYRAAAFAGFVTQIFWGFIRVMIFEAFYRSSTAEQPMTLPEVITYIWLGQALFAMLPWSLDREIRQQIRTGTVAYEMLRPIDLYAFWYSRAIASRTAPTLLRAVPLVILAMLFLGMQLPESVASGFAWAAAMVGALLMACAVSTLLNISLLWTIEGEGVARIVPALFFLLSGMIVPIPLFPEWAQKILLFLPFSGLIDTPFRLYIGHLPPEAVFPVLIHQLCWTFALITFGRWLMSRGTRILVVQGG